MNWGRLHYYQAHLCTAYLPTRSDLVLLFVNYLLLLFSSVIVAWELTWSIQNLSMPPFTSFWILFFSTLMVYFYFLSTFSLTYKAWDISNSLLVCPWLRSSSLTCKSWEISTPTDCSYQTSVLCHDLISCFSCRTHFTENITQWIAYSGVCTVMEFQVIFSVKCVQLKEQLIKSRHRTKVWYEQSVGVEIYQDLKLRLLNCNQEQNNFSWFLKCRWSRNSFEITQRIEKS